MRREARREEGVRQRNEEEEEEEGTRRTVELLETSRARARFRRAMAAAAAAAEQQQQQQHRSGPSGVWKRSTNIESSSRAARKSMMGIKTVTRMQQTRSRDPCRTSRLCRRPCHCFASSSLPPGSKWPKRHRSLSEPLGRRFRTHFGSAEPRAQPQRSKWLHGSPAESVMLA